MTALVFCTDLRKFLLRPEELRLSVVIQARGLQHKRPGVTDDNINPEGYSSEPFDRKTFLLSPSLESKIWECFC